MSADADLERSGEVLLFGAALRVALERRGADRGGELEHAQVRIPYSGGYRLRGRWLMPEYAQLRNAAWAVRNCRVGPTLNPLALKLVLVEAERLVQAGEQLIDVLEAFAELLSKP